MSLNPINIKYFKLIVPEIGHESAMDIAGRCIICGDSIKNPNKKRLHLYTKNSYNSDAVSCFNCGYSASVYKFIEENAPNLLSSYKSEMGWNSINALKPTVLTIKKKQTLVTFDKPHEFKDISTSKIALNYLINRKIKPDKKWYIAKGTVKLNDKEINLNNFLIVPLLTASADWYGFYSRSTDHKYFYTYIPEENSGYKIYNWFLINKKERCYIFESIMDMLSTNLPNSIACLGSDINSDRLKELSDPIFVFDNDKTGKEKSMKYIELGHKCCTWPNMKEKDANEMLKTKSKEEITNIITDNIHSGFVAKMKLLMN